MAGNRTVDLSKLIKQLETIDEESTQKLSDALNKTADDLTEFSVQKIAQETTLSKDYIAERLYVSELSNRGTLTATISGTERGTLMTRFNFSEVDEGIKVQINRSGGSHLIKGAFKVRLRAGASRGNNEGIALRNKDAVDFFERNLSKGKRTPAKQEKLAEIRRKSRTRPNGLTVLHSRSINQMFESVREEKAEDTIEALAEEFFRNL